VLGEWGSEFKLSPPKTLYFGSQISRSFGKKLWKKSFGGALCWPLWKLEAMKNPLQKGSNC